MASLLLPVAPSELLLPRPRKGCTAASCSTPSTVVDAQALERRWVADRQKCLENEAKIMKDVSVPPILLLTPAPDMGACSSWEIMLHEGRSAFQPLQLATLHECGSLAPL